MYKTVSGRCLKLIVDLIINQCIQICNFNYFNTKTLKNNGSQKRFVQRSHRGTIGSTKK